MDDGWSIIGQDDWLNSQWLLIKWLRDRLEKAQVTTGNLPKPIINMKTSIQSLFMGEDLGQLVEIEGDTKTPWKKEDHDISCEKGKKKTHSPRYLKPVLDCPEIGHLFCIQPLPLEMCL